MTVHDATAGRTSRLGTILLLLAGTAVSTQAAMAGTGPHTLSTQWRDSVVAAGQVKSEANPPVLELIRQDHEKLQFGRSVIGTPLRISQRSFEHGLGTHSVGHVRITSAEPIRRFSAWVGVDANDRTSDGRGSVTFAVQAADKQLYRSEVLRGGYAARRVEVETGNVQTLDLHVGDGGDGQGYDHADWADAQVVTASGRTWWLDEAALAGEDAETSPWPFSFTCDGQPSRKLLPQWTHETKTTRLDADREQIVQTWTDTATGLRISCTLIRFSDFAATEWLLHFENTGVKDTGIIAEVNAMDLRLHAPRRQGPAYQLYRTHGGVPDPTQFDASIEPVDAKHPRKLRAGNGRSSTVDFPFFKIDTRRGAAVIAVGWSGCWKAD